MAFEYSLLERIERGSAKEDYKLDLNEGQLVDSVLDHLRKILNVRQGSVESLPDYGLPDINGLAAKFPNALYELKLEIKSCIDKYEPRLSNVRVEPVQDEDNPLYFKFEITASLQVGPSGNSIWFETTLDPSGKATIRG